MMATYGDLTEVLASAYAFKRVNASGGVSQGEPPMKSHAIPNG